MLVYHVTREYDMHPTTCGLHILKHGSLHIMHTTYVCSAGVHINIIFCIVLGINEGKIIIKGSKLTYFVSPAQIQIHLPTSFNICTQVYHIRWQSKTLTN